MYLYPDQTLVCGQSGLAGQGGQKQLPEIDELIDYKALAVECIDPKTDVADVSLYIKRLDELHALFRPSNQEKEMLIEKPKKEFLHIPKPIQYITKKDKRFPKNIDEPFQVDFVPFSEFINKEELQDNLVMVTDTVWSKQILEDVNNLSENSRNQFDIILEESIRRSERKSNMSMTKEEIKERDDFIY